MIKPKPEPEVLSVFVFDTITISENSSLEAFLAFVYEGFSDETIESLREYGEALRDIHNRLISEGYVFKDGEFYKPGDIV